MKKTTLLLAIIIFAGNLSAKKVRFSVDMTGQTISPNGVHITGDFQAVAGLGPDWNPGSAPMSQVGNTSIYSIIVNLPAFKKYEYRILNGDQTYESEFVPEESRVQFEGGDNRWLYVDSLANDTTFVGAILFGGNAPAGKTLIRYKVDMNMAGTIPATGVHVGTSYQPTIYSPQATRLYSFGNGIYEIINYVTNNSYSFIYYNGNTTGSTETVPGPCATNGKRTVTVSKDTVLAQVCFSSCVACVGVGITENTKTINTLKLFPNPASSYLVVNALNEQVSSYAINDLYGKEIISNRDFKNGETIDISVLVKGIYFIVAKDHSGSMSTGKFAVE
ncbi:MAG: T9SS type A sorting domain-containing protein [Bacteroidota bacterium]